MRRRAVLLIAPVLLAAGCTSSTAGNAEPAASSAAPATDLGGCRRERAIPDPNRPVVDLDFSLAEDRRTVTGTETVAFTPDLPTGELVFRLVPNGTGGYTSVESGSTFSHSMESCSRIISMDSATGGWK